jgi:hypothetical protein
MAFCRYEISMVQKSPSRDMDKVIVRLPDGMRDRIKRTAEANNRSMNAEIVATLEEKYPAPKRRTTQARLALAQEALAGYEGIDPSSLSEEEKLDFSRLSFLRDFFTYCIHHPDGTMRDFIKQTGLKPPS